MTSQDKHEVLGLLADLFSYMDKRADTIDTPGGAYPNEEMRYASELDRAFKLLEKEPTDD